MKKLIFISLLTLISSCQNSKVDYSYPKNPENIRNLRAGKFFEDKNFINHEEKPAGKTYEKPASKNKLWLSSIEVVSSLLPIDVLNESSGMIITEWYQDGQNKDERIKINLLVKGEEVKKENLVLTIFKQTKNFKGSWVDSQPSKKNIATQMIADKIIEQAKSK